MTRAAYARRSRGWLRRDPVDGPPLSARARGRGPFRLIFPAVFLIYLVQTAQGAIVRAHGAWTVVGLVVLTGFCGAYLGAVADGMGRRYQRFRYWYVATIVLFLLELPIAHQDALPMLTYIAVLSIAARFARAVPLIAVMVALALFLPPLVPGWHAGVQTATGVSIGIVSLAMFAFFGIIRANEALEEARSEVARLAAEGERTRIARDLHDLLGHSLTTITVKAGLASRLSARDPERAAAEIAEVEQLTRRVLTDVRAAVSGYREVTLGNELANAREVLRAAGINARLPGAIDAVAQPESELFAWVVREGVTNVVRHSRASSCEIRIAPHSIEISDDGVGYAGSNGRNQRTRGRTANGRGWAAAGAADGAVPGNGLTGLRERVAEAGGRLTVGPSSDGGGFRVLVEVGG